MGGWVEEEKVEGRKEGGWVGGWVGLLTIASTFWMSAASVCPSLPWRREEKEEEEERRDRSALYEEKE